MTSFAEIIYSLKFNGIRLWPNWASSQSKLSNAIQTLLSLRTSIRASYLFSIFIVCALTDSCIDKVCCNSLLSKIQWDWTLAELSLISIQAIQRDPNPLSRKISIRPSCLFSILSACVLTDSCVERVCYNSLSLKLF